MLLTGTTPFKIRQCRICGLRYKCPFYDVTSVEKKNKQGAFYNFLVASGYFDSIKKAITEALNAKEITEAVIRNANCIEELATEAIGKTKFGKIYIYGKITLKERFFQDAVTDL